MLRCAQHDGGGLTGLVEDFPHSRAGHLPGMAPAGRINKKAFEPGRSKALSKNESFDGLDLFLNVLDYQIDDRFKGIENSDTFNGHGFEIGNIKQIDLLLQHLN